MDIDTERALIKVLDQVARSNGGDPLCSANWHQMLSSELKHPDGVADLAGECVPALLEAIGPRIDEIAVARQLEGRREEDLRYGLPTLYVLLQAVLGAAREAIVQEGGFFDGLVDRVASQSVSDDAIRLEKGAQGAVCAEGSDVS